MELASSTLTAALVGVIMVLSRVIEWMMNRNNRNRGAKDYNGLGEVITKIDTRLDIISANIIELRQCHERALEHLVGMEAGQERIVERLGDVVSGADRMAHSINDLKKR